MLTNPASDRIKAIRALAGRFGRSEGDQRVVAEGPQAVREAVATGRVVDLYLTEAVAANWPDWAGAVSAGGGYVHLATEAVLTAISPASQGVVGVVDWSVQELADYLDAPDGVQMDSGVPGLGFGATQQPPALVALFEEIRDPGNAGTAIRAADAAGANAVIFSFGSVDPRNAKVIRASAGSTFHLPVIAGESLEEALGRLRSVGCQILAADAAGQWDIDALNQPTAPDLRAPTVWLFGNEARGLSAAAQAGADATVRLPIYGQAESLNLAMAATLCLYASARAQR